MLERHVQIAPLPSPSTYNEVRVSWSTILKVLSAVLLAFAAWRLRSGVELLLLSALLAIALSPIVDGLEGRGAGRRWVVAALAVVGSIAVAAFCVFVIPPLTAQVTSLWSLLPHLRSTVTAGLDRHGLVAQLLLPILELPHSPELKTVLSKPLTWGPTLVEAVGSAFLGAILALYLLLDGRAVVAWLLAYVPRRHRGKMSRTVPEVFSVVKAYASGQLITSALFAIFCFVVLTTLRVPVALPLALFAGICDAIPVAGILVATAAAGIVALTVGPGTAATVLGLYILYHLIETYLLVPRLYGERLRLSALTVFLAILAGGLLDGVVGAILSLPIVAAYPVVEKHWLAEYLHPDAVEDHASLLAAGNVGAEGYDAAVDAVLRGEKVIPAKDVAG